MARDSTSEGIAREWLWDELSGHEFGTRKGPASEDGFGFCNGALKRLANAHNVDGNHFAGEAPIGMSEETTYGAKYANPRGGNPCEVYRLSRNALDGLQAELVARFGHGLATHTPRTNWVWWVLAGIGFVRYSSIEDAGTLFRHSDIAFCHQISSAFVWMASQRGASARLVQLHGHVVAEALIAGNWHLYDPDFGVPVFGEVAPSVQALHEDSSRVIQTYGQNRLERDPADLIDVFTGQTPSYSPVVAPQSTQRLRETDLALRLPSSLMTTRTRGARRKVLANQ